MIPPVRPLEQVSRVAPLGVRFHDEVTGGFVGDGLVVAAHPSTQPSVRKQATVNRSSVYTWRDLPGLRGLEFGAGDAAYWSSLPAPRRFTVEVSDAQGRFLPFSFQAGLPHPGLFGLDSLGSPPSPLSPPSPGRPALPLFSAPARRAASTVAVLRAELWDTRAQAAAASALVKASAAGIVGTGVADAEGRVAVLFQYPEPEDFAPGSPADASSLPPGLPLLAQTWPLQLDVFYARRFPVPDYPDLGDTLSQPPAFVWPDTASSRNGVEQTLRYGQELVVRTQGDPRSRLWITPVGSPH